MNVLFDSETILAILMFAFVINQFGIIFALAGFVYAYIMVYAGASFGGVGIMIYILSHLFYLKKKHNEARQ